MKKVLLYIVISVFSLSQSLFATENINIKEKKEQSNNVVIDEYKWGTSIVDDQNFNIDTLPKNKNHKPCAKPQEVKQCGPK